MLSEYLANYKILKQFVNHNYNIFSNQKNNNQIFLVEFHGWQGIHIAFSYLINFFLAKKNFKIVAFESYNIFNHNKNTFLNKLKWVIGKFLKLRNFGIYKSFGVSDFIKPQYNNFLEKKSLKKLKIFYKNKNNLRDLENLKVENIWIGDLIYDSYLKKFSTHTIDLNSKDFKFFFFQCLCNFYFWNNYFEKNSIKGVLVAHSVYISGIPLRIANKKNIKNFYFTGSNIVNGTNRIVYKNKQNNTDIHFRFYKKIFQNFSTIEKKKNIQLGKKYLRELIEGKKKYFYLKKTAFKKKKLSNKYFNKNNKKLKVIIYPHLFTDSPHVYGNHFFPDFFEWLKFLEKVIKKTNYNWYIKRHPNEDKITRKIIKLFIKKNPNVKLLPKNFSNFYISKAKINFALTLYGTIGSELPGYNVKVINASINNPHFDYNFCINPKNITEYKKILLNLNSNTFKINKRDLYEFHYMKNHYSSFNDYIFSKVEDYFKYAKKRQIFLTNKSYKIWLENFSIQRHKNIVKMIEKFVVSGDYMIFKSHK